MKADGGGNVNLLLGCKMIDLTFTSMILGQTIWVFFIQSGVLMKFVGRERFVPVMMKITKVQ